MKHSFSSKSGQTLIIVLTLLALLSIIVLTIMSRVTTDIQITSASTNQYKVDAMGQSAVSQIIGDLRQEIAAGSYTANSNPYNNTNGIYFPYNPACSVPSRAVPGTLSTAIGAGYENVVKVSYHGVPFFDAGTHTNSLYNIIPNRAANCSTYTTSLNGRAMTDSRWEKPCLTFTSTNYPSSETTTPGAFPEPDWIYVARDGSNPSSWDASYQYSPSVSPLITPAPGTLGTNPVMQRYSYIIYDEGGTLDMNVAGSPVSTSAAQLSTVMAPYKNSLAYADLTKLPGINSLSATDQASVINAIVGWRNYSSSQVTGHFPTYSGFAMGTGSNLSPFDMAVAGNTTGFLQVSNNSLYNGMSDQPIVSRQQLIQLLQSIGNTVTTFTTNLQQQALVAMGTFTRDINQPSYAPDPNRPPTQTLTNGGNDKGSGTLSGADAVINPPLLNFPVSERFALSRLAWLTYEGPIADDSGNLKSGAPFDGIITQLENQYGYSAAFLSQGGPSNIYKYFGLSWVADSRGNGDSQSKWVYNHEGSSYLNSLSSSNVPIRSLGGGTYPVPGNRSPDFFELLKATVPLGSLGKAYSLPSISSSYFISGVYNARIYQQVKDNSVDLQILQIGANIIDQFDTDSYSTRILFSDGSLFGGSVQEIRGVEDLPYLYRVREGKILVTDSNPSVNTLPTVSKTSPISPGKVAVLQEPEIWNPHSWSSLNQDSSSRPTSFRVVAVSTDPNSPSSNASNVTVQFYGMEQTGLTGPISSIPATLSPWTENTTELDFKIPRSDLSLFREPTLLIKPNVPTNSSLQAGSGTLLVNQFGSSITSQWPATQIVANGVTDNQQYIGFLAATGPAAWSTTILKNGIDGTANPPSPQQGVQESTYADGTSNNPITYRMQYQDASGNWVTYDEKYIPYQSAVLYSYQGDSRGNGSGWSPLNPTFSQDPTVSYGSQDNIIGSESSALFFDPRTSRWGGNESGTQGYGGWAPAAAFPVAQSYVINGANNPSNYVAINWYRGWGCGEAQSGAPLTGAIGQMALATTRPDIWPGFTYSLDTTGIDWGLLQSGPGYVPGWFPANVPYTDLCPGQFCQNNPNTPVGGYWNAFQLDPSVWGYYLYQFEFWGGWGAPNGFNEYVADGDGIVRRAMAAWVPVPQDLSNVAIAPASGEPTGIPTVTATDYSNQPAMISSEQMSRPIVLNRPFHSVAELGYVFMGTPWRNLDMSTPESCAAPLLDAFCMNPTSDANELVAGKLNLNGALVAPFQAVLSGAYKDEFSQQYSAGITPLSSTYTDNIAKALVTRTSTINSSGEGPLMNISQLVGSWHAPQTIPNLYSEGGGMPFYNGSTSYIGFSSDSINSSSSNPCDLNQALIASSADDSNTRISRVREAAIRALGAVSTTRVWNLMIDVVVQTGRFPSSATGFANFNVEGERRYWVHLAIDRYTGKILDSKSEIVTE